MILQAPAEPSPFQKAFCCLPFTALVIVAAVNAPGKSDAYSQPLNSISMCQLPHVS